MSKLLAIVNLIKILLQFFDEKFAVQVTEELEKIKENKKKDEENEKSN